MGKIFKKDVTNEEIEILMKPVVQEINKFLVPRIIIERPENEKEQIKVSGEGKEYMKSILEYPNLSVTARGEKLFGFSADKRTRINRSGSFCLTSKGNSIQPSSWVFGVNRKSPSVSIYSSLAYSCVRPGPWYFSSAWSFPQTATRSSRGSFRCWAVVEAANFLVGPVWYQNATLLQSSCRWP